MDVFKKDNQDEENDHELFKDCFEIYFILFSDVDFNEPLVLEKNLKIWKPTILFYVNIFSYKSIQHYETDNVLTKNRPLISSQQPLEDNAL